MSYMLGRGPMLQRYHHLKGFVRRQQQTASAPKALEYAQGLHNRRAPVMGPSRFVCGVRIEVVINYMPLSMGQMRMAT